MKGFLNKVPAKVSGVPAKPQGDGKGVGVELAGGKSVAGDGPKADITLPRGRERR